MFDIPSFYIVKRECCLFFTPVDGELSLYLIYTHKAG